MESRNQVKGKTKLTLWTEEDKIPEFKMIALREKTSLSKLMVCAMEYYVSNVLNQKSDEEK